MQIRGRNYLIPVGAPLDRPDALSQTAMPVDYLITRLKDSGAHLSLVMLDACRNDPDEGGFSGTYRGAGAPAGFVAQKPANGMLVAYAAPTARSRRRCRTGSRARACPSKTS
jgi:uncharacterized caspase-like protein